MKTQNNTCAYCGKEVKDDLIPLCLCEKVFCSTDCNINWHDKNYWEFKKEDNDN